MCCGNPVVTSDLPVLCIAVKKISAGCPVFGNWPLQLLWLWKLFRKHENRGFFVCMVVGLLVLCSNFLILSNLRNQMLVRVEFMLEVILKHFILRKQMFMFCNSFWRFVSNCSLTPAEIEQTEIVHYSVGLVFSLSSLRPCHQNSASTVKEH